MQALGVGAGDGVRVAEWDLSVEVRLDPAVAEGVVALAQGIPGAPPLGAGSVSLERDPDFTPAPGAAANVIARG